MVVVVQIVQYGGHRALILCFIYWSQKVLLLQKIQIFAENGVFRQSRYTSYF
jgi:hypothetical protein